LIEIHGSGGKGADWTAGCIALTNRDMDSLFKFIDIGTPVTIVGSMYELRHVMIR
jgi:lipoprotein-anchoring transpeptidase ErfK/SrfK